MKKIYLFLVLSCLGFAGYAQTAANYTWASSNGSYTAISTVTSTTVVAAGWDTYMSSAIALPFTFKFAGSSFSNVYICGDGWLSFSSAASSSTTTPLSTYLYCVSAMAHDMASSTDPVVYTTTGTAPNRVFTVQWSNAYFWSASGTGVVNFQIKLYESSNVVQVVYGACATSQTTNRTCMVGINGAATTDYNNRQGTTGWGATTAGTANTQTVRRNNTLEPASGLTFTWTPPPTATGTPATISFLTTPSTTSAPDTAKFVSYGLTSAASISLSLTGTNANLFQIQDPVTFTWITPGGSTSYTASTAAVGFYDSKAVAVRFAPGATPGAYTATLNYSGAGYTGPSTVTLNGTVSSPCSGTPTAGTVSSATTVGCNVYTSSMSLSGATVAPGITYQWQASPDNTTWTNAAGTSTGSTYTGTISATSYYRCTLTCTSGGGGTASTPGVLHSNYITPTPATIPFTESFEAVWASCASTAERPNYNWLNTPTSGNNSWRADNTTAAAGGWSGTSGAYTPVFSAGARSARFHSFNASSGTIGSLDLYITFPAGSKTINYDYINTSGTDQLKLQISTDNGASFTDLDVPPAIAGAWTTRTVLTSAVPSVGTTAILRFKATSDFGATDIGLDNVKVCQSVTASASPTTMCAGGTLTLSASSISGATYAWSGPSYTSAVQNPAGFVTTAANSGTYTVTATNGGCVVTSTVTATVNPNPTMTVSSGTPLCTPAGFSIGGTSTSWSWAPTTNLSSTNSANPVATPTTSVTYTITGTLGSCTSTITATANPTPSAIVSPTGSFNICVGSQLTLSSSPAGGSWTRTNGTGAMAIVAGTGRITGSTAGTSTATYTSGGCTATQSITIDPTPTVSITGGGGVYCSNAGSGVTLTNGGSTTLGTTYAWSPAGTLDNTTGISVVAIPTVSGANTYSLTSTLGNCSATTSTSINRHDVATAFNIVGGTSVCVPGTTYYFAAVSLTPLVYASGGVYSTASGTSATVSVFNGVVSGVSAGTETISYSDASCGSYAISQGVTVAGTGFTIAVTPSAATYCATGSSVSLDAVATEAGSGLDITNEPGMTWVWASDLGTTPDGLDFTNVPGVHASPVTPGAVGYVATASRSGGCNAQSSATYITNNTANISGGLTSICVGTSTTWSTGGLTGGAWSVSSGTAVTVNASGVVTGLSAGSATVAYTKSGCVATRSITVGATPGTVSATPSSAVICNGGSTSITASASAATSYSWSPATGLSATTGSNVTASPSSTTTYTITANGGGACSSTGTVTITNNNPAPISGAATSLCPTASVTLTDATPSGIWSSSSTAVVTVSPTGGVVTGVGDGTATITYTSTLPGSCYSTRSMTVNAAPLTATPTVASVCGGTGVALTASGASTYTWAPNTNLSASTGATVTSTATSAITYTVTGVNSFGCTVTLSKAVGVGSAISATAVASSASVCPSSAVTLTATMVAGSSYTVTSIPYSLVTIPSPSSAATGDQVSTNYSMGGMTFRFFGNNYTTVNICSNGNINFGAANTAGYGGAIPSTSLAQGSINLFSHDMNTPGTITYGVVGTAPNRRFVVSYNTYGEYLGTGTNSGEIILYEGSNMIDLLITNSTTTQSYSSTCGIQNIAQNSGVAAPGRNYNIFNITTPEAWRFYPPVENATYAWTPTSGVTATGSATTSATVASATTYSVTISDPVSGCNAVATVPVGVYSVIPVVNPTAVPTGLTFTGTTATGTSLSLTAGSPAPTNYLIVKSTVPFSGTPVDNTTYGVSTTLGNGTVVTSGTAAPFAVTGLTGNTQYYITALPYNATSCTGPLYYAGTQPSQGVITCPAAPGTPTVAAGGPGGMTLSWSSSTGGGATTISYSVEVATDAAFASPIAGSPFATTTTSSTITGLTAGSTYYYRVTAIGAGTCNSAATAAGSYVVPTVDYSTVTVSGFNNDVIAEGTANPSTSTTIAFDNANYDFLSQNYNYLTFVPSGTNYLPASGGFVSAATSGLPFQLANYAGSNSLRLTTGTSGTLTFTTPQYASQLFFLASSGSGTAANTAFTVNYADGSTDLLTATVADWYGGTPIAIGNVGRVLRTTGAVDGTSTTGPNFYQYPLSVSAANYTKKIVSVFVNYPSGGAGILNVAAVSKAAGVMASSATSLSAFASTTVGCSSTTLSFNISGTTLYPASGALTATAPTGFQVSANGTTWGSTANIAYTGNTMASTPVYVRFTPVASGVASGNITFTGGTVNTPSVIAVSGTATLLTVSASSSASGVLCTGGSATLTGSGTGVASYTWSPAAGLSATTGAIVTVTPTVTTTYTVTGVNAAGCTSATSTVTVTFNGTTGPISTPGGVTTICTPGSLALIEAGTGGTWSTSASSAVATIDANGVVYGVSTGTAPITYSNASCGGDAYITLNIATGGFTVAVAAAPSANYCNSGSAVTLTATDGGAGASFSWSPSTGLSSSTGATVLASPSATTIYTVTGTVGVCSNSSAITITNITPAVITGGTTTICRNQTTSWTSATGGGTWTTSDATIASVNGSGVVTGTATTLAGTATITYTVGGCYVTRNIFVNILPTITATPTTAAVCGGTGVTLTASGASTYTWTPGTGLSAATGSSVFSTASSAITYTITGTSVAGCSNTLSKSVAVGSSVTVSATASSYTVCAGSPTTLTATAALVTGSLYDVTSIPYSLQTIASPTTPSLGDDVVTTGVPLGFTFNYFGTNYTTCNVNTNGYINFGTSTTTGYTTSSGVAWPSTTFPQGAIGLFLHDMTTGSGTITYGTNGTAPNRKFIVYYNNYGEFGGTGTNTGEIILYEGTNIIECHIGNHTQTRTINYYYTGIQNIAQNNGITAPGRSGSQTNITTPEAWRFQLKTYNYAWTPTSGVASTAAAVTSATVSPATTYTVLAADATTGCSASNTVTVANWPAVLPAIAPATPVGCIGGVSTTLTISATAGPGTWSNGTYGAIATIDATTGGVTGVSAGTAVMTYTNICGATTTRNVVINASPTVISVTPSVTSLCIGGTATLSNGTPGGTWTSSNPTIASIDATSGLITTIAGGSITFTYTNGCGTPATIGFAVNDAPVAITPLTTVDACIGQTTTLSEVSLGGTWSTTFGSIATVNSTSGVVTGVSAGTATITYGNGCGADVYRDVNINPAPGPIGGFGTICQATSATLTNSLPGGTWVSSNTAIATVDASTGIVGGTGGGTATISYVTTGCNAVTATETVTPIPAAITGASVMCVSNTTTLANTVPGGTWSSTSASGSGSINSSTGVVTSTASVGTITVSYTNSCGAAGSVVTVSSTPSAITGTTNLCASGTPTVLSQNFNDTVGQIPVGGLWTIRSYGSNPASANNWRLVPASPTTGTWTNTTVTGDGSTFIGANADAEGSGTTIKSYITSPSFSTIGLTAATLTFNEYGSSNSTWDAALMIQYTTDGGTAWNNLISFYGGSSGATSWTAGTPNYAVALPTDAVGVPNVMIRFYYQSSWGFYWAMDNVQIIGPAIAPTSTLADATPAGATPWSSANTAIATINSSTGVMTGVAGGTTNITYTTPCGSTFTPVTINAAPAPIGGSASVCVGATITLTNASTGGTWSSLSPSVATVNAATGAVTGLSGGTAYIAYGSSCGASTVKLITVNAAPSAITGATALCPTSTGNSGILLNTVSGTWSSATPAAVTVNAATGAVGAAGASGTSSIITFTGACGSATTTVTVGGGGATAPIVGSSTLCSPLASATDVLINNFNTSYTGSLGGTWNMSVNVGNYACGFNRTTSATIGDGSVYLASSPTSAPSAGANVELTTPTFSTVGMTSATVTFNHYLVWSAALSATVDYSTNGGSSWTTITSYTASTGTTTWSAASPNGSVTLPAAALGNATTMLRWKISGTVAGSGDVWYLDNFKLQAKYAPSTVYTDATPGGTWSSSNLAAATVSGGTVFGVAAGTTNISYSTSCGAVGQVITVMAAPGPITGASTTLCAGTSFSLSNSSAGGTWSSSNTSVATVNAATGQVYGVGAGTANITYATACGTPTPYTLTVLAQPAAITGATAMCASSTATLTNTTAGGTWTSSDPTIIAIGSTTGVMTSSTSIGSSVTISYNNGCTAANSTVVVSGSPSTISGYTSLCVPSTGTITLIDQNFTSLTGATGGTWSVVNTSGNSASYFQIAASPGFSGLITGDGSNFAQAVPNAYGSGVAVTELRSPSFSTVGMTMATLSFNLYYSALSGDVVTLDYSTNGGSSWSNLASTGGTTFGTATWTAGTPNYTTNLPAAALDQSNVLVRVYYSSNGGNWLGLDNVKVVANKFSTILTNGTPGGTWATSSSAVVSVAGTSGVMTAVTAGTANISYTACSASVGTPVTIKGIPGAITGISSFCVGASITAANAATGGTWSVVNTAVATVNATTGQLYGVGAGTTTISYSNGCGNAVGTSITVKAPPAAIVGASSMCPSTSSPAFTSTTNLTNTVGGGTWTTSDATVATVGSFSGIVTAALTATSGSSVTITYSNGCGTDATSTILIDGTTNPIVGASSICSSPSPLVLTSFESGVPSASGSPVDGWNYVQGVGAANGYFGSIAGASTSSPVSGVPAGGGTNVVVFSSSTIAAGNTAGLVSPSFDLTGGNGGRVSFYFYRDGTTGAPATAYDSVAVYVNTTPTIGGTRIGSVCRSRTLSTAFTGTVGAASWQKLTYTIPSTFTGATNYIVIQGVSALGNNMYLDSLMIRNNSSVTTLTDASAGGVWSTSAPTVATVTTAGIVSSVAALTASQTVTITYTGACGTPAYKPLTVNAVPGTNTAGATTLCPGSTTTTANSNVVPGGVWSSSNTSVASVNATTGVITAIAAGSSLISYTAGCGTPGVTAITVNPMPTVAYVTSSATTLCAGSPLVLTAGAASGTGTLASYNWSGPGGYSTTSAIGSGVVTYTVPGASATGQYSVTVTYPGAGCTSAPVQTGTVTVNDYPIAYNVTGGNGCTSTGITVGLNNSQSSAINYTLIKSPSTTVASLAGTSTTLAFAPVSASGTYIVKATSAVGCVTTMNGADTINTTPSASVSSAMPNICQPTSSASVGLSTIAGAPTTYSVAWNAIAHSDGLFSDITAAPLTGSSVTLNFNPAGGAGSFDGSLTLSNGACTSAPYPVHVIVHANPAVSVAAINPPCIGHAGSIDFTGTDSTTVAYSIDGGTPTSFLFAGTTYNLGTGVVTTAHNYLIIDAHNAVCTTSVGTTVTVTPVAMAWVGGTGGAGHESEWNRGTNWTCGFAPTATDDVLITSVISGFDPAIPTSFTATTRNLTIGTGGVLVIDGTGKVEVSGSYTNTNNVYGAGKVVLNGTAPQRVSGIGTTNNLELNNTNGATVDTGSRLIIGSTLTLAAGTLHTNDSVELASTDTNSTGRIAEIPTGLAAISGKVKVDQYVMGGYRRYRFLSHPFSDTLSLMQLQPYVDITGTGGAANGFVTTGSNAPSAYRLNTYLSNSSVGNDPGWKPFLKINGTADTNKLHPGQGMRLFFRGAKGEGLGYVGFFGLYTPSSSVIKMVGNVNQGNVSIPLAQGANAALQSFNMIGNPYPSPVDMGTVLWNARVAGQVSGAAFYVFDPALGASGNFVSVSLGVGSPIPYYVQGYTALQVIADHNGAHIDFTEADKSANISNYLFKAPVQYTDLSIYDEKYHKWDVLKFNFDDKATDEEDKMLDAVKPMGVSDFNFYSTSTDNRKLSIDSRPFADEKVIPLGITSGYQQNFIIRADNVVVPAGGKLVLHDKLLEKYVEMKAGTEYAFTIGKDKSTQGSDRFELAMKSNVPAAVKPLAVTMTPNPTTDDVKISFTSGKKEKVTVRVMDISGVSIFNQDLGEQQNGTISVPLSTFAAGIYMVELTQGEQKVTQRLVKE